MTPLRAQIVAARAYEVAWHKEADWLSKAGSLPRERLARMQARAHRRAAEIMEAEAAKEEGGERAVSPPVPPGHCHAASRRSDGECVWEHCPVPRNDQQCPLIQDDDEEDD